MLDHFGSLDLLRHSPAATVEQAVSTDEHCRSTDEIAYVGYKFAPFDGLVSFEEQKVPTVGSRYSYKFRPICWSCGEQFSSARSTTKTCSPKCRDNLKYIRKGAEKAAAAAARQIDVLSNMAQSPDPIMRERARQALRVLYGLVTDTCNNNGINPHRK